jgi:hypothetical protein
VCDVAFNTMTRVHTLNVAAMMWRTPALCLLALAVCPKRPNKNKNKHKRNEQNRPKYEVQVPRASTLDPSCSWGSSRGLDDIIVDQGVALRVSRCALFLWSFFFGEQHEQRLTYVPQYNDNPHL